MFKLTVSQPNTQIYAAVHQTDKRQIGSPTYFDVGVTFLREDCGAKKGFTVVGSAGNAAERQNQVELEGLSIGTYIVVPTSTGCRIELEKEQRIAAGKPITEDEFCRDATLTLHSDQPIFVEEISFNQKIYDLALELPVLEHGEKMDLFGDDSLFLYTLRSGATGTSYVAENTSDDQAIHLQMDFDGSENIVSENGDLKTDKIILPGRHLPKYAPKYKTEN